MPTWLNPAGFNEDGPSAPRDPRDPVLPLTLLALLGGGLFLSNRKLTADRAAYAKETQRLRVEAEKKWERARAHDRLSRSAYQRAGVENADRRSAQQARLDAWLDAHDLAP